MALWRRSSWSRRKRLPESGDRHFWSPNRHTMPRYYFHLEGGERIADKRGRDLPDDNAARREAEGIAAALQRSRGRIWGVIVTNEWGHKVIEISAIFESQWIGRSSP
jgi:hypothetical protein